MMPSIAQTCTVINQFVLNLEYVICFQWACGKQKKVLDINNVLF